MGYCDNGNFKFHEFRKEKLGKNNKRKMKKIYLFEWVMKKEEEEKEERKGKLSR